jgi:hypothetical protein
MPLNVRKPAAKRMDDHHRAITNLFQANCHRHRPHAVFSDFCEMAALAVSNAVDLAQFAPREERYLQIAKTYDRAELARFTEMLACVTEALEDGMHDCLGKLFMALEMGNHWKGQFFTPWELCSLMARVTLVDAKAQIEERGFITISEPAAGAGAMVIAIADALREQGFNYQKCMHVTAVDVDPTAAHMCYLQLALLHVPAVVVVGNSLTLEERSHWFTPAHVLGGWGGRLRDRRAITDLQDLLMPPEPDLASAPEQLDCGSSAEPVAATESTKAAPMAQADLF